MSPYKVIGTNIMHKKDGKWSVKQKMKSKKDAYGIISKLKAIEGGKSLFTTPKKSK